MKKYPATLSPRLFSGLLANRGKARGLRIACGLLAFGITTAQAQNPFGQLQQLLRPIQPANNAPAGGPAAAAGLLNMLSPGAAPNTPGATADPAAELIKMLGQSVEQIDQPKEIEIGRQLAAVLLGSKPLHPDMRLQRYVNRLGRWISLYSTRPELPWSFAVLDDPGYNAFAAPGGYIFVTKGLVDRLTDEAELAGILAHEINHVAEKHHLKALRKSAQSGVLTQLLAQQLGKSLGAGVSSQLLALGRDIYSKGLDQQDEFEADRNGVALATRAGFDPYGLPAVLQQLRAVAPSDAAFALTLSTHPPAQLRLDQLEAAMGTRLDGFSNRPPVSLAQRLSR